LKLRPEIFISFCKSTDFELNTTQKLILTHLYTYLKKKGYDISSSHSLGYKENISDFIEKLGKGQYIILILSDQYLKSVECMSQIIEILKNQDYSERIYPIILDNFDFFSEEALVEYIIFWEEKKRLLIEKVSKIERTNIEAINKQIDLLHEIRIKLSSFWTQIKNMKVIEINDGIKSLNPLYKLLENQIRKDKINKSYNIYKVIFALTLVFCLFYISILFVPSKVILHTDIECIVDIENKPSLIVQTNKDNFIELKKGNYQIILTVEDFPEIKDTIQFNTNWFWKKSTIYIELFDKTDKTIFLRAQQLDNVHFYNDYLIKFPYGSYTNLVNKLLKIKELNSENINTEEYVDYHEIIKNITTDKINEFKDKYPESAYNETFDDFLNINKSDNSDYNSDNELFIKAKSANTIFAYQKYIDLYPTGKYFKEAELLIDSIENANYNDNEETIYLNAVKANIITDYENYLEKYPIGKFRNIVYEKIELLKAEKSYLQATKINKIRTYETYLEQYPDGEYSSIVLENIEILKKTEKLKMVLIEKGTIKIGGNLTEVKIHSFFIDKYEVTVEAYKNFCNLTNRELPEKPTWGWNDNDPIVNISWEDANSYALWAGKRLPTEAEWEFAAKSEYADIQQYAWFKDNSNSMVQFVGQKKPNKNGIFDILGNVMEWCNDWYSIEYPQKSDLSDPKGPITGTYKVLKGGAWNNYNVSATIRFKDIPNAAKNYYGFRCVSD